MVVACVILKDVFNVIRMMKEVGPRRPETDGDDIPVPAGAVEIELQGAAGELGQITQKRMPGWAGRDRWEGPGGERRRGQFRPLLCNLSQMDPRVNRAVSLEPVLESALR